MPKTTNEAITVLNLRKRVKQFFTTPLYANAFYLMLNTAVTSALGFFFWVVVARFYTQTEVGFSSAIISAISLLSMLSLIGLNVSLVRFLPQAKRPQELINSSLTLVGLISLIAAGIFLAGINLWSPALSFIGHNAVFALTFIAFTVIWTLYSLMGSVFLAKRRAEFSFFKNTIFSLFKIPLPILFASFFHTFGIVASWGIAIGLAFAISLFLFLPKVQNAYKPVPTLRLSLFSNMRRYSAGNYLANLLSAAPTLLLPLMVVNILGAESNAYFYVAWMIAGLLSTIPVAISSSLFTESSHFEKKLRENAIKSLKFTFLLLVPSTILFIFFGKWLLLLFGENYSANALKLMQILAISSLPLGINSIYMAVLRVSSQIKELSLIYGLTSFVLLLTSYLTMPIIGIIGIAYGYLGIQLLLTVYVLLVLKRKLL